MNKCYCGKEGTEKYETDGKSYCKDHIISVKVYNQLNIKLVESVQKMREKGIKEGSVRWIAGNFRTFREINEFPLKLNKIIWKNEYRQGGIKAIIKILIAKLIY